jgi:Trk K+ transport system NAD-binding subunit
MIQHQRQRTTTVPDADWLNADACELSALEEAGAQTCDVLIAATGDDKANLVVAYSPSPSSGDNTALTTVLRGGDVILPQPDGVLEAGDELLFVADHSLESTIRAAIHTAEPPGHPSSPGPTDQRRT